MTENNSTAPLKTAEMAICERCAGSGEDPEGFLNTGRGPNDYTVDGPCRQCGGSGEAVAAQAGAANVIATAPTRIWLDLGDDVDSNANFKDLEEVTWSSNNASGGGVKYVRADVANPAAPAAVAVPDVGNIHASIRKLKSELIQQANRAAWAEQQVLALTKRLDMANAMGNDARNQLAQLSARQAAPNPWQQAVDHELVTAHLGVAGTATSEEARKVLNELICWHIAVATDPQVNGGFSLQPAQAEVKWQEGYEFGRQRNKVDSDNAALYMYLRNHCLKIKDADRDGPAHPHLVFSFDEYAANPETHNVEGLDAAIKNAML